MGTAAPTRMGWKNCSRSTRRNFATSSCRAFAPEVPTALLLMVLKNCRVNCRVMAVLFPRLDILACGRESEHDPEMPIDLNFARSAICTVRLESLLFKDF